MIVIRQQLLQTASGNLSLLKSILVSEGGLGKPQQTGLCLSWKNFGESRGELEVTGGNNPIQLFTQAPWKLSLFQLPCISSNTVEKRNHSSISTAFITLHSSFLAVKMMKCHQNQSMI